MRRYIVILSVLLALGSLSAQSFVGKVNPFPTTQNKTAAQGTLRILAVMVEFQEDRNTTTSGNGKFGTIYSTDYGTDIIDPLPHDQAFFEDHLLFAKNYFRRVSGDRLNIEYTVLPDIVTVSKDMKEYTPLGDTDDFSPLAQFVSEVWTLADQNLENFEFGNYDLFAIFHAGVGKDVSVPGSIGNEKDLPSVYMSLDALQKTFGETYQGVQVNGNFIPNSMILPETENRELEGLTGTVLLELSFNGLLVASIASHLGLPDLFDTETGLSAIGRFGLMDGQSIFAYSGLFPPEMSAWEKYYLGWAEPTLSDLSIQDYTIVNHLVAGPGETSLLKVPINDKEYFLLENRQRDAYNDGLTVTYRFEGETRQLNIPKDTTGFYSWGVDTISGVVIDVDEFDWAIPGNGITIWHIDENIIDANIADNKINIDKLQRGVDLEEADGVQDIGEEFTTITGDVVIGEGWDKDFWFAGNDAELYTNEFSASTRPNTNSNTGAESLISFSDFSAVGNRMTFNLTRKSGDVLLLHNNKILHPTKFLTTVTAQNEFALYGNFANADFNLVTGEMLKTPGNYWYNESKLATAVTPAGGLFYSGIRENFLFIAYENTNGERFFSYKDFGTEDIVSQVICSYGNTSITLAILNKLNEIFKINILLKNGSFEFEEVSTISYVQEQVKLIVHEGDVVPVGNSDFNFAEEDLIQAIGTETSSGEFKIVGLSNRNKFVIKAENSIENEFKITTENVMTNFVVADLTNDDNLYIVYPDGDKIFAINFEGVSADNFPFSDPLGMNFKGQPLTLDLNSDQVTDIVVFSEDGRIFALDGSKGELFAGFPISAGSELAADASLSNINGTTVLSAVTVNEYVYSWQISSSESDLYWAEEMGNTQNTSFVSAPVSTGQPSVYFDENRAYNWPNPVYGDETYFRYFVSEDSEVKIKIFDLAGDFVAELDDQATGGFDNETTWNVSDVQSGVYFAHLQVTSANGQSSSKIIKVAIIK